MLGQDLRALHRPRYMWMFVRCESELIPWSYPIHATQCNIFCAKSPGIFPNLKSFHINKWFLSIWLDIDHHDPKCFIESSSSQVCLYYKKNSIVFSLAGHFMVLMFHRNRCRLRVLRQLNYVACFVPFSCDFKPWSHWEIDSTFYSLIDDWNLNSSSESNSITNVLLINFDMWTFFFWKFNEIFIPGVRWCVYRFYYKVKWLFTPFIVVFQIVISKFSRFGRRLIVAFGQSTKKRQILLPEALQNLTGQCGLFMCMRHIAVAVFAAAADVLTCPRASGSCLGAQAHKAMDKSPWLANTIFPLCLSIFLVLSLLLCLFRLRITIFELM